MVLGRLKIDGSDRWLVQVCVKGKTLPYRHRKIKIKYNYLFICE